MMSRRPETYLCLNIYFFGFGFGDPKKNLKNMIFHPKWREVLKQKHLLSWLRIWWSGTGRGLRGILNFYNRTFCGPQTSSWASTRHHQELSASMFPSSLSRAADERTWKPRTCVQRASIRPHTEPERVSRAWSGVGGDADISLQCSVPSSSPNIKALKAMHSYGT